MPDWNEVKEHMHRDIVWFSQTLFPHHIKGGTPKFHEELYRLALAANPRKGVVCPRGFGKSTTLTFVYILYSILFRRQRFIVIISDSHSQAKLFLEAIADELTHNELLIKLFGNLTTDQWSQESITTSTGIRVIAKGSGQKLRGLKYHENRPTLMLFDDIENDEAVATPEQRLKLKRWFYGAALPALAQDGQAFIVGTILHEDSLLNNVYENDKTFLRKKFTAVPAPGESLWPEHHPYESLMRTKASLSAQGLSEQWAQEYMCQAVNPETAEFRSSDFAHYDAHAVSTNSSRTTLSINNVTSPLNVTIALDPSMGRSSRADFSAIVVLGAAPDNHVYVLDVVRQRLSPDKLINVLFDLVIKYQPLAVRIETNGFQYMLAREVYSAQRRRNVHFKIEEYKSTTNKEVRIRSMVPPVKSGSLVFPERANPMHDSNDLLDELITFPKAKHDDASDACEAALSGIIKPQRRRGKGAHARHYQPASMYGGY